MTFAGIGVAHDPSSPQRINAARRFTHLTSVMLCVSHGRGNACSTHEQIWPQTVLHLQLLEHQGRKSCSGACTRFDSKLCSHKQLKICLSNASKACSVMYASEGGVPADINLPSMSPFMQRFTMFSVHHHCLLLVVCCLGSHNKQQTTI